MKGMGECSSRYTGVVELEGTVSFQTQRMFSRFTNIFRMQNTRITSIIFKFFLIRLILYNLVIKITRGNLAGLIHNDLLVISVREL